MDLRALLGFQGAPLVAKPHEGGLLVCGCGEAPAILVKASQCWWRGGGCGHSAVIELTRKREHRLACALAHCLWVDACAISTEEIHLGRDGLAPSVREVPRDVLSVGTLQSQIRREVELSIHGCTQRPM